MGELGQIGRSWLALQKLTCVGDWVLGCLQGANHAQRQRVKQSMQYR